ncbi:MAG: hypothetical protein GF334_07985 [Candidatus Altiarchaeales archaeon]|nr:hypothetical protein [Candidatus Altiarchaeales archaeon]
MMKLDPHWRQFAASRRDGDVFVKMPRSKARGLALVWSVLQEKHPELKEKEDLKSFFDFLAGEEEAAAQAFFPSVFYQQELSGCEKDASTLQLLEDKDSTGLIKELRSALLKGMKNDPAVDWIARVGGPKRNRLKDLEKVTDSPDTPIIDLEELYSSD